MPDRLLLNPISDSPASQMENPNMVRKSSKAGTLFRRSAALLRGGSYLVLFLLPLILWPGLGQPFSTPKWLLLGIWSLLFPILWLLQDVRKFPLLQNTAARTALLIWLCCLSLSSLMAPKVSLFALLAPLAPLPLFLAVNLVSPLSSKLIQALQTRSGYLLQPKSEDLQLLHFLSK